MTLRIGVDATAVPAQRTGAGNYVANLLGGLARADSVNDYVVFAKRAQLEELGIDRPNFCAVPVDLPARGVRLAWEQLVLPRLVRAHGVHVLHSPHYTMPVRSTVRTIVTFHDMTFVLYPELHQRTKRLFFPPMMRWSATHASRIITVSESTRQDLIRLWNVPPGRVVAIPLAAGGSFVRPPDNVVREVAGRYGITASRYILYVGVIEPRKNVDLLVTAFARVAARHQGMDLVVAGRKGWMYEAVFEQVEKLGLRDRVRFLGFVPDADLPALYGGARAFVYPSLYEGFGLPVLEAMCCGTPVVTTNISSLPEVAGDGALLVEPRDVEGLAAAIAGIWEDECLAQALAARGRERAAAFSWERVARETLQVYAAAAAPPTPAATR